MHTALGITAYSLDLDPAPACFTHVDTVSTGHFVVQAYGKSAIKTAMASQTWLFSQQDQLEPSREKTRARLTVIQLSETDVGKALCVYEFKWQSGNPLLTSAWKPWCSGGERVGNKANGMWQINDSQQEGSPEKPFLFMAKVLLHICLFSLL